MKRRKNNIILKMYRRLLWHIMSYVLMFDFEKRETVTLKEITPFWWGKERYENTKLANDINSR